ncbi:MAG: hypothetical protein JXD18_06965 [Anaerolineae bacterium]|nr:hypothetical protein [Anaerolineae bacterium]
MSEKSPLPRRLFLQLLGGVVGGAALGSSACQSRAPHETGAALPLYVDDGTGWPVYRGPYLQRNAHIAAFLLPADGRKLAQMCDRYLNDPANRAVEYAPLVPNVFVLYAEMSIASLDARDQALGWTRETELSFWVPTVARASVGGLLVTDHLAWFLPALVVDNPYAIATGREVFGFPKLFGQFEKPADIRRPEFDASVWGFERLGPDAEGGMRPWLDVRRTGDGEAARTWSSWDEAWAEGIDLLLGGTEPSARVLAMDEMDVPLVFLKQFRDASDTQRACYQALVEAPARVQQFYNGGPLEGTYHLTFHALESPALPQMLGLPLDASGALQAITGLWVHLDFTLEAGTELWSANAGA